MHDPMSIKKVFIVSAGSAVLAALPVRRESERTNLIQVLECTFGGPDSVVGIATAYGLDGPGIESRRGPDFPHESRPALRPIQPPAQRVPSLSRG